MRLLKVLLWLALISCCWSPGHARAECSAFEPLLREAKTLAGQKDPDSSVLTRWTLGVGNAQNQCPSVNEVRAFRSDSDVANLLSRPISDGKPRTRDSKESTESGAPPQVSKAQEARAPTRSATVSDRDQRIELTRARLIVEVRFAVMTCGTLVGCNERGPAIQAVKDYVMLLIKDKTDDTRFAEFADALSVLGTRLTGVPPGELDSALIVAGRLSSMTAEQADSQNLPEAVTRIMKDPPSAQRTEKLLDVLVDIAKNSGESRLLGRVAESLGAVADMEARIKQGEVRSLLLDVSAVPQVLGNDCDLRQRVRTSAKQHLTRSLDAPPLHEPGECPKAGCDIQFAFRVDRCDDSAPEGARSCLRIRLRMSGATSDVIARELPAACIDAAFVTGMINRALSSFERVMEAQDAWTGAPFVPKGGLYVENHGTPTRLPQASVGTGIHLLPGGEDQDSMADALEKTFGAISHRGTGTASPKSRATIALRWQLIEGTPERLRVTLSDEAHQKSPALLQFDVRGNDLAQVSPEILAQHVTARVIRYYESEEATPVSTCQARFQDWYYRLLLAGLRRANDCDPANDVRAKREIIVDSLGMTLAAVAGLAGFTARNLFSAGYGQGWLTASRGLYIGAGLGLAASVSTKVIAW
jgi:hypothetical protein